MSKQLVSQAKIGQQNSTSFPGLQRDKRRSPGYKVEQNWKIDHIVLYAISSYLIAHQYEVKFNHDSGY
jgi:hypothetical protein